MPEMSAAEWEAFLDRTYGPMPAPYRGPLTVPDEPDWDRTPSDRGGDRSGWHYPTL